MKILARQLTLDLYNCSAKKMNNVDEIKNLLEKLFGKKMTLASDLVAGDHFTVIGASATGHVVLHVYCALQYVAADIFDCAENAEPEEISKTLRKFFRPDKMKSTFLKRGDFGTDREIKPKIKTRVAPLRKVRNAGEKVVKKLVRRSEK